MDYYNNGDGPAVQSDHVVIGQPLYGLDDTSPLSTNSPRQRRRHYGDSDADEFRNYHSLRIVVLSAVVVAIMSAATLLFGYLLKDDANGLTCPGGCHTLMTVIYIATGVLGGISVLGFMAAVTKWRLLAYLYAILIFLLFLVAAAFGAVAVCVSKGVISTDGLETVWKDAVADNDGAVCTVQSKFSCTGFNHCCGGINFNTSGTGAITIFPSVCNLTLPIALEQCSPLCSNNAEYLTPCQDAVQDSIKSHLYVVAGVAFAAAFLFLASTVASVRTTFRYREYTSV